MNRFDMMRDAVNEAETTIRAADRMAVDIAAMLVGRLRAVSKTPHPTIHSWTRTEILRALKKELKGFNAATGKWQEQK